MHRIGLNPSCAGWEIIAEDESKDTDQHGALANLDSSPGTSGIKMGHGASGQSIIIIIHLIFPGLKVAFQ